MSLEIITHVLTISPGSMDKDMLDEAIPSPKWEGQIILCSN